MDATNDSTPPPPTAPKRSERSASFRLALAEFSQISDAELRGTLDGLTRRLEAADSLDDASRDVARLLAQDLLEAARTEWNARIARHRAGVGANPRGGWSQDWLRLRDEVKARTDLAQLLQELG